MLKSTSTTYELSKEELKEVLAKELNVNKEKVTISFVEKEVGDDRFGPTHKEVVSIKVLVTN